MTTWSQHSYQPDPPIFTPRIWMAYDAEAEPRRRVVVGDVLRSDRGDGSADNFALIPDGIPVGSALVMTTYCGPQQDVATTTAPLNVTSDAATGAALLAEVWTNLDPFLRVAALVADPRDFRGTLQTVP